jgi:hypothetical protein
MRYCAPEDSSFGILEPQGLYFLFVFDLVLRKKKHQIKMRFCISWYQKHKLEKKLPRKKNL